jgi:hypothetical protein
VFKPKLPYKLIEQYSDAVAVHGPNAEAAWVIRRANEGNRKFMKFADAIDTVKRAASSAYARPARNPDHVIVQKAEMAEAID